MILEAELDTDGVYKVVGTVDPWSERVKMIEELLRRFDSDYAKAVAFYEQFRVKKDD